MKFFALTKLGKKVARTKEGSTDEMRIVNYLAENKTASEDELDIVVEGGRIIAKRLVQDKLVVELN